MSDAPDDTVVNSSHGPRDGSMDESDQQRLRQILDRSRIYEVMCRYARAVDRRDWDLLRSTFHPDSYDDHGEYKGGVEGFIEWVASRHAAIDNSMHFLGNCLVEFAGPDVALVETYFVSSRIRSIPERERAGMKHGEQRCVQSWGRYVDRFERRSGEWRVAYRTVVFEARFASTVTAEPRDPPYSWGTRDALDPLRGAQAKWVEHPQRPKNA